MLAWQLAGLAATHDRGIAGISWAFFAFQLLGVLLALPYGGGPLGLGCLAAEGSAVRGVQFTRVTRTASGNSVINFCLAIETPAMAERLATFHCVSSTGTARLTQDLIKARPGTVCFQLDIPEGGVPEVIVGAKAIVFNQQVAIALVFQCISGLGTKVDVAQVRK